MELHKLHIHVEVQFTAAKQVLSCMQKKQTHTLNTHTQTVKSLAF